MMSGYFGFDNAGDEAICAAIIQTLRQLDPSLEFIVLSGNPDKTAKGLDVMAIPRMDLRTIWKELKKSDLFISGGGSLLQDKTGNLTIPYYLTMIQMARWSKVPVAIYAQGIGPVERPIFQKWIRKIFAKLSYISVRDTESLELLTSWGISSAKVEEVVDPVFLLRSDGVDEGKRLLHLEGFTFEKPPILLSVRNWKDGTGDFAAFAELCDQLVEKGEEVLFTPFHYPDDLDASLEVLAMMRKGAKVLNQQYTPSQLLDIIANGKMMIAMRLHALIFAAARQIPCIGISYDPKIDSFLNLLGERPIGYSGNLSVAEISRKVNEFLSQEQEKKQELGQKAVLLNEKALRPARQVIELVNNGHLIRD